MKTKERTNQPAEFSNIPPKAQMVEIDQFSEYGSFKKFLMFIWNWTQKKTDSILKVHFVEFSGKPVML
jgi:hypothetical protein